MTSRDHDIGQRCDPGMLRLQLMIFGSKGPPIGNGLWRIEWPRAQWRHVTLNGSGVYDGTDIMWCQDKLIHWLLDSELTDEFQLVNNFTVHETSSQLAVNKFTHSKTFLSHRPNVFSHASSRRTVKFTFNQTLISRDFSILFRLPKLGISQTENSLSTKACEAAAANRSTANWLYAFGQLLNQNSRRLSPIIRLVWI